MAYTLRQLVTAVSAIYLLALTAIAAYALSTVHTYSLPIPTVLAALDLVLPVFAGLSLESITTLTRPQSRRNQHIQLAPQWLYANVIILVIYETAVATLAGTHLPSNTLTCGLDEQWHYMFRNKKSGRIRRIQDSFNCCGLHSVVDKAWPFPGKRVGTDACASRFERSNSCFDDWRAMEQKVALMMMLVPILVFVWKMLILTIPQTRESWLSQWLPADDSEGGPARRALEYPSYSDSPIIETDEERTGAGRTGRRVARARESASESLASLEASLQPSGQGQNEWADERHE